MGNFFKESLTDHLRTEEELPYCNVSIKERIADVVDELTINGFFPRPYRAEMLPKLDMVLITRPDGSSSVYDAKPILDFFTFISDLEIDENDGSLHLETHSLLDTMPPEDIEELQAWEEYTGCCDMTLVDAWEYDLAHLNPNEIDRAPHLILGIQEAREQIDTPEKRAKRRLSYEFDEWNPERLELLRRILNNSRYPVDCNK